MAVAPAWTPSSRSLNVAARNATQKQVSAHRRTTRRNAPMKQQHIRISIAAALAAALAPAAHAIDVTAGDWKLSFDGNVNADYIYSHCAALNDAKTVSGGLTCVAAGDGQRSSSSVSNGLLPAAL